MTVEIVFNGDRHVVARFEADPNADTGQSVPSAAPMCGGVGAGLLPLALAAWLMVIGGRRRRVGG